MEFTDDDGYIETSSFFDVVDTNGDSLTVQPPPDVTPPELVDVVLSESFFYSYEVIDAAEVGLKFKVNDDPSGLDLMSAAMKMRVEMDLFCLFIHPIMRLRIQTDITLLRPVVLDKILMVNSKFSY